MNKKQNIILILFGTILIILGIIFIYDNKNSVKFKKEYIKASKNNKFVYKTEEEIINILEKVTGIIYFGFPECPWCQEYIKYLDDISNKSNIKEVYYLNIFEIRKNNTDEYKKIVNLLKDYLDKDENNNPRIFVPHVVAVKDGKIIDNDNETSMITESISTKEYWTEDKVEALKNKLKIIFDKVTLQICTDKCN